MLCFHEHPLQGVNLISNIMFVSLSKNKKVTFDYFLIRPFKTIMQLLYSNQLR
jgi:hypothetical protein